MCNPLGENTARISTNLCSSPELKDLGKTSISADFKLRICKLTKTSEPHADAAV